MQKTLKKQIINKYLPPLFTRLKKIPYLPKIVVFATDILFVVASLFVSYYIRYVFLDDKAALKFFYIDSALCVIIAGFFFAILNTYSEFIRFSSFRNILRIVLSLFCTNLILLLLFRSLKFHYSVYAKVGFIISFLLSSCSILFFRISIRIIYAYVVEGGRKEKKIPLLIYGIDPVNIGMAEMIRSNDNLPYAVAGFISLKRLSYRSRIMDYQVYSPKNVFSKLVPKGIKTVLVLEGSHSEEEKAVLRRFTEHKIELLSAPPIENLNAIRKIRKIRIEDLLRRDPITIDMASISQNLQGKTILITGAAGSIGSEIVRQICRFDVGTLLLCDSAESPLHQLCLEVQDKHKQIRYIPLVADVRNQKRMESIFEQHRPQYIYHAAAYKHVPLMELYPSEAVATNIAGTKIVADLAVACHAECFVMISTDKAVNPSSVMGASKRIAEIYIQSLSTWLKKNAASGAYPRFITTRFGNVLGSNGSVIPRFTQQIAEGGPITVTHRNIIRYFMTIPEACSLVLEAGNFGKGGEVFVFDMGEPVKIREMAEEMIRLSGLEPYKDIDIVYTGLRPGEKLREELLYDKEAGQSTYNKNIMIGNVREYDYAQVTAWMESLLHTTGAYKEKEIVSIMKEIVPEFISANSEFEALDKI